MLCQFFNLFYSITDEPVLNIHCILRVMSDCCSCNLFLVAFEPVCLDNCHRRVNLMCHRTCSSDGISKYIQFSGHGNSLSSSNVSQFSEFLTWVYFWTEQFQTLLQTFGCGPIDLVLRIREFRINHDGCSV